LPQRARSSLTALFVGWAAGEFFFLVYSVCQGDFSLGWIGDGVLTLLFAAPVWLVVMLPLSLFVRPNHPMCRARIAPFVGAAIALPAIAGELALVYPLLFDSGSFRYVGCALCIGATAWSWFAWLLRRSTSGTVPDSITTPSPHGSALPTRSAKVS
jgi:hypothetical protein